MSAEVVVADESSPAVDESSRAVEALLESTPVLVGVASRTLDQLDGQVSLTQLRLLFALTDLGAATPSVLVAQRLGSAASSVSRLAARLEDAGYLLRRRERPNRNLVRLELTRAGRALVRRMQAERRRELSALVSRLPAGVADQLATGLEAVTAAAGPDRHLGPIELQPL